ncbi:MAG: hypothetical protein HOI95_20295 [Chromatiales bacterium]|jgi:Flp pilus assembly protein TadD|nr:hypothetical protein [Chromatiales bacterium]
MNIDADTALQKAQEQRNAGALDEALRTLRRATKAHPHHVPLLHALGLELDRQAHHLRAAQTLSKAAELAPTAADIVNDLGNALQASRQFEAAAGAYRRAADLAPSVAGLRSNIGHVLQMLGDQTGARTEFNAALEIDPRSVAAHYQLAVITLGEGNPNDALEHINKCTEVDSYHPEALSLKVILLMQMGHEDEAQSLHNTEQFLKSQPLEPPAGYANIREFNRALERYILDRPLTPDPYLASTRGGRHGDDLLWDAKGPAADLGTMLQRAFGDYINALPVDASHPFMAASPKRVKLIAQANILDSAGYLVDHVHPQAWVSGAYYVRLPREVNAPRGADDRAGWLRFGALPEEIASPAPFESTYVQPVEGLLVLFPAYFYHGTVPFRAKKHRMSLGIDAIAH